MRGARAPFARRTGQDCGVPGARSSTVYVADDHPVYRDGIVSAIRARADLELVGQGSDGRVALEEILAGAPNVALLDMNMPELDGMEVLEALRKDGSPTAVLFISASLDGEVVYRALAQGAAGYLSKDADRDDICDALAAVARGGTWVAAEAQTGLADAIRRREVEERPALSPREREVLRLTADGRSSLEIAEVLHLSPATIKSHLQSLYQKLGVSDRAAAVAVAMRQGLLD